MFRAWVALRLRSRIRADLQRAHFAPAQLAAVLATPAMCAQLERFYRQGGRIENVPADFSGANGAPQQITFYCPATTADCVHSSFSTLAHELGHALQYPEQWRELEAFASAHAYAASRELGEAHAWLNQYQLCLEQVGVCEEFCFSLEIENDGDFDVHIVDLFAEITGMRQAGADDATILAQLAMRNANMFPSGMGENNFKTYGQCNRWDWMVATGDPALHAFVQQLGRALTPNEQKLLVKFNLLNDAAVTPANLQRLARRLQPMAASSPLHALYRCAAECAPQARCGVLA